jgi:hypothetical protein
MNWMGYVMGNYDAVMPVVYNRKLGVRYVYQPSHCQQLGVFSGSPADRELIRQFMQQLVSDVWYADYAINASNDPLSLIGMDVTGSPNYVLDLAPSYADLVKGYSTNCKRNLKRAEHEDLIINEQVSVKTMLEFKQKHDNLKRNRYYRRIASRLFHTLEEMNRLMVYGTEYKGKINAFAAFAVSKTKLIYLLSASDEDGREKRSMFRLIDQVIQIHSGTAMQLDFEGSVIPSIARFFGGFGAVPETYGRIRYRRWHSKKIMHEGQ